MIWAAFLFFLGDPSLAACLMFGLVATIGAVSWVKRRHLGMGLIATDLFYLGAPAFQGVAGGYRREIALVALAALSWLPLFAWAAAQVPDATIGLELRAALLAGAVMLFLLTYRQLGGGTRTYRFISTGRGHFSTFAASLFALRHSDKPVFEDVAAEALTLSAPVPATVPGAILPDICLVQHESTFDPRQFGLSVNEALRTFLSPPSGLSGTLHVDPFGGASIMTEFSVLTGLSARSFGVDGGLFFRRMVCRVKHALPAYLASLGYRTAMVYTDHRRTPVVDAFFADLGFQERHFWDELPPPFDFHAWQKTCDDGPLYRAVLAALRAGGPGDKPLFLFIPTMLNHGPHSLTRFPTNAHAAVRREAMAATGDRLYAEYRVRQAQGLIDYAAFREELSAMRPGRPVLQVRYGDHLPGFAAALAVRQRRPNAALDRTFFAMEAEGFDLVRPELPPVLDTAFLGSAILQVAGLPLDAIFATRASLMAECGTDYFGTASERKRRFHRTLVESGLVLASTARQQRSNANAA